MVISYNEVGSPKSSAGGRMPADADGHQTNKKDHSGKKSSKKRMHEHSDIFSLIDIESRNELGPAVKSIFEKRNEKHVLKHLHTFSMERDAEIKKICQDYYQVCVFFFLLLCSSIFSYSLGLIVSFHLGIYSICK